MLTSSSLFLFALAALIMALTPGPNMIYLISRSICQGKLAGMVSLLGVALGFICYMVMTVLGLTALFLAIPYAYETIKILGALYLLWLAWKTFSEKTPTFQAKALPKHSLPKLFSMGFFTNILNPKVAVFYVSLFPQFINLKGSIISQTVLLGVTQIAISFFVNGMIVLGAAIICDFFNKNASWAKFQKWLMGFTLCGLAFKMMLSKRPIH